MNNNFLNIKTVNSFLAARKSDTRKKELFELKKYVDINCKEINNSIHFVKYWGASDKIQLDKYDYRALLKLFGFLKSVEREFKREAYLTIIFSDTHAILNGYNIEVFAKYFKEVEGVLNNFNYQHMRMSELLSESFKLYGVYNTAEFIEKVIQISQEREIPSYLQQSNSFEILKVSAEKHSYRLSNQHEFGEFGFKTNEQSAYAYVKLNQIEKKQIEKKFPNSIFLTYTSDQEKDLISPDLLSLQIYSYRTGIRSRPWFVK